MNFLQMPQDSCSWPKAHPGTIRGALQSIGAWVLPLGWDDVDVGMKLGCGLGVESFCLFFVFRC